MIVGQEFSPQRKFTGYFVPECLLTFEDLSLGAKLCLAVLYRHMGDKDTAWPRQDTLAAKMACSVRTISGYLSELETQGFIRTIQHGLTRPNSYIALWHRIFDDEPVTIADQDRKKTSGQDRQETSGPSIELKRVIREESHLSNTDLQPSSSEQTQTEPEAPTARELILYMNSRKGCHLSAGQRRTIEERGVPPGMTLEQAAAHFDREFERGGYRRPLNGNRERPAFSPRQRIPPVEPNYAPDPQYNEFCQAYQDMGGPYAPPDKAKGRRFWEQMPPEHRSLAVQRIRVANPEYVKHLPRWLEAQDYLRRPRPLKTEKPLTNAQKFDIEMAELFAKKGMVWKNKA